jgi:hypothetical protein
MFSETKLIALNPVLADRADDFEEWLRTIAQPALEKCRPDQVGRWQALRSTEAEEGVITFVFLFAGASEEWELLPLLEEALGAERAKEAMSEFDEMFNGEQHGWLVNAVNI